MYFTIFSLFLQLLKELRVLLLGLEASDYSLLPPAPQLVPIFQPLVVPSLGHLIHPNEHRGILHVPILPCVIANGHGFVGSYQTVVSLVHDCKFLVMAMAEG